MRLGDAFFRKIDPHLSVVLQPIYALTSGKVYAFEALTRGAEGAGFDSPHALFDEAAQRGLLHELELKQAEKALALLVERFAAPRPRLFLNLDIRLLEDGVSYFEALGDLLEHYGVGRGEVCIELSERHEKNEPEVLRDRIDALRAQGFRFALDDFGHGVSDIMALYYFNIEVLKIDRFLIDGLADSPRKRFFASRLVELAHLLGLIVVAEGVERAADLAACVEMNFDLAQGYHLTRPMQQPDLSAKPLKRRPVPLDESADLRTIVEYVRAYRDDAPVRDLVETNADESTVIAPIVDERQRPIGQVDQHAFNRFVASPFTLDLLKNSGFKLAVSHFSAPCPICNVTVDPTQLLEMCASTGADAVIVTEDMKYLGVVRTPDLLALSQARQLRVAREANPLSGLPGNAAIKRFLERVVKATECERLVVYFDFDKFKPFNDAYGFARGDLAIVTFADIMKSVFNQEKYFLGHVGGDDFFLGAMGRDFNETMMRVDEVLELFAARVASLYTGSENQPPLEDRLTCSAAVVRIAKEAAPQGMAELAERIAETKKHAKASDPARVVAECQTA